MNLKALYPNTSDEGVDLLRQLLVVEPELRISAEAALRHDFVKEFLIPFDESLMEQETAKFDFGFESEVKSILRSFPSTHRSTSEMDARTVAKGDSRGNRTLSTPTDDDDDVE